MKTGISANRLAGSKAFKTAMAVLLTFSMVTSNFPLSYQGAVAEDDATLTTMSDESSEGTTAAEDQGADGGGRRRNG